MESILIGLSNLHASEYIYMYMHAESVHVLSKFKSHHVSGWWEVLSKNCINQSVYFLNSVCQALNPGNNNSKWSEVIYIKSHHASVLFVLTGTQKIWLKTWGCSHNNSDSEYMAGQLASYGYTITGQEHSQFFVTKYNLIRILIITCNVRNISICRYIMQDVFLLNSITFPFWYTWTYVYMYILYF